MCGTPSYLAPEVVRQDNGEGYDNVVDSWSVGVIVFSMCGVCVSFCGFGANHKYTTGLQLPVPSLMMIRRGIFASGLLNAALTGLLSSIQMQGSVFQVRISMTLESRIDLSTSF